jgi:hypothetical protein
LHQKHNHAPTHITQHNECCKTHVKTKKFRAFVIEKAY